MGIVRLVMPGAKVRVLVAQPATGQVYGPPGATTDIDPSSDIHASAEFRAHLARVNTQRALELAASR